MKDFSFIGINKNRFWAITVLQRNQQSSYLQTAMLIIYGQLGGKLITKVITDHHRIWEKPPLLKRINGKRDIYASMASIAFETSYPELAQQFNMIRTCEYLRLSHE